ncbi:hypothetical protein IAR50_001392 [Cryptococcus sp. DSM 104548]
MSEKPPPTLPLPNQSPTRQSSYKPRILLALLFILATTLIHPSLPLHKSYKHLINGPADQDPALISYHAGSKYALDELTGWAKCPEQPQALYPNTTWELTEEDKERTIGHYRDAVRIPTQSYDDNGEPNDDPRWKPFFDFQNWLRKTYPLAHETAKVEYINTLGILATFQGSDPSLKPLLLMSHYDVVPAPEDTYDRWTHPPFSAHNDGEYIWGRGASDVKPLLIAQWETITHLLSIGFTPRRTIILSHGFDEEEVFARRGQGHIAPFLERRYGKDGLLMVIDEGGGTQDDFYGGAFALPGMGEKGYLDIRISVGTAGGHSSQPPVHSGIGIMSQLLLALEDNALPTKLTPASPYLTALTCASSHSPDFPRSYSSLLASEGPKSYPKLARALAKTSVGTRSILGTTTAVDVIHGGLKVNALPELVTALINFQHNGLALSAFDGRPVEELEGRYLKVDVLGLALEPAPRTPSEGGVWELFAGTVKAALPGPDGQERIVSPYASTGNTDCKMYYNLTKNVYRFGAASSGSGHNAHTVDEKASIEGYLRMIEWIHAIVQNADAYTGEE